MKIVLPALFVAFCISFFSSVAQEKKILPVSPEASGLLKFVNYPVNYSTGIPDIGIDLFEIKAGDVTLPLRLSYHSGGGIKTSDRSTWVGLGWQLSADPEITRTINSNPDEATFGYLNNPAEISNFAQITKAYAEAIYLGNTEEDPDEFYYKLNGKGGKFYLIRQTGGNPSGVYDALTVPYEPVLIKYTKNSRQFSVKDDDGTTYNFGGGDLYEWSGTSDSPNQTSWKCSTVISASKRDTLFFSYYQPDSHRNLFPGVEQYVVYDSLGQTTCSYPTTSSGSTTTLGVRPFQYGNRWTERKNLQSGIYSVISPDHPEELSQARPWIMKDPLATVPDPLIVSTDKRILKVFEIKYRSGKVKFHKHEVGNSSWGATQLDSICVLDYNDKIIKTVRFYYTQRPEIESISLDSLIIKGASAAAVERYAFAYDPGTFWWGGNIYERTKWTDPCGYFAGYPVTASNSTDATGNAVPFKNISMRKLCWAYYEGPVYPSHSFIQPIGTAFQPNYSAMQAYVLKKITYPTGGRTEFTYEPNQARGEYPDNVIVRNTSGLRISNIKIFSDKSNNVTMEKSYKYGIHEEGAGYPQDYPRFPRNYMYEQAVVYYTELLVWVPVFPGYQLSPVSGSYVVTTERKRTYSSRPFNRLFFSGGAPVLYSQVTEYQLDRGKQTGKTVYLYNNENITESTTYANTPLSREPSNWHKGQLLAEIQYGYVNGKYVWVKKKDTGYASSGLGGSVNIGKVHNSSDVVYDQFTTPGHLVEPYKTYQHYVNTVTSGKMLVSWVTDSTRNLYDTLQTIGVKTNYHYDNPQSTLANRVVSTDSKGNVLTDYIFYTQDYPSTAMLTAHMLTYEMEKVSTLKPVGATSLTITGGVVNTYTPDGLRLTEEQLEIATPKGLSEFKFSNAALGQLPETSTDQSFSKDPRYAVKNRYAVFDDRGNICQVHSNEKTVTSYIWGYKKLYPIAQAINALSKDIFYTGFEEDGNSAAGDCKTGRKSRTTSYSKSLTGLTNGKYLLSYWKKTSGVWSSVITPVTVSTGAYTISLTGQIDDVRFHPEAAQMSTYTYDPLVGVTSITDAKGLIMKYEYDASGRLSLIKDLNGHIVKQFQYHYNSQR
jgi:YD repeat-containing protein